MAEKLHLKIAVAEHPHTSAIRNGSIAIHGVEAAAGIGRTGSPAGGMGVPYMET